MPGPAVPAMTSADWIEALDRSRSLPAMLRPCALLDRVYGADEPAHDGAAPEPSTASLPVGRRDALLLELQQALFGPQLDAVVPCPHCRETLELHLRVADLLVPEPAGETLVCVERDGYRVRARLPDSRDLAAAALADSLPQARGTLMQRCVLEARRGGDDLAPQALPAALLDEIGRAMSAADPQADAELALSCPTCAHAWSEPFDIARYLVDCLEHWAENCLDQVHILARAYGWSEAQILALNPARRARYIERVLA